MLAKYRSPVVYTILVLAGGIACILFQAPVWATAVTAVAMMLIADQLALPRHRDHRGYRKAGR